MDELKKLFEKYAILMHVKVAIHYDINNYQCEVESIIYHLVSNAIAHCNSDAVTIKVTLKDNKLTVEDDGKGLDELMITFKAARQRDDRLQFDRVDLLAIINTHGFTTKDEVNEVSGHGQGLNEVLSAVKSIEFPETKKGFKVVATLY